MFANDKLSAFQRSAEYGSHTRRRYVFRVYLGRTSLLVNGAGSRIWKDDDFITFREHILKGEMGVWKGSAHSRDPLFESFPVRRQVRWKPRERWMIIYGFSSCKAR